MCVPFCDAPRKIDPNTLRYSQAQMNFALLATGAGWFMTGVFVGVIVSVVWVHLPR